MERWRKDGVWGKLGTRCFEDEYLAEGSWAAVDLWAVGTITLIMRDANMLLGDEVRNVDGTPPTAAHWTGPHSMRPHPMGPADDLTVPESDHS